MTTTELVAFLATQEFTDDQAYNLIVADLNEWIPAREIADGQSLVAYFLYKIQSVCLPAIREARKRE